MKNNYKEITVEHLQDEIFAWKQLYKELKEENKKLSNDAMEDMKYMAKLELKIKMLMDELQEVYRQNVRIKKDLAAYERLRDQLFWWLEEEDLYEDIK